MDQKVGLVLMQDIAGNEGSLQGENRVTDGGNLAKLHSELQAASSALELNWLV